MLRATTTLHVAGDLGCGVGGYTFVICRQRGSWSTRSANTYWSIAVRPRAPGWSRSTSSIVTCPRADCVTGRDQWLTRRSVVSTPLMVSRGCSLTVRVPICAAATPAADRACAARRGLEARAPRREIPVAGESQGPVGATLGGSWSPDPGMPAAWPTPPRPARTARARSRNWIVSQVFSQRLQPCQLIQTYSIAK